jgi:hypothetical protein
MWLPWRRSTVWRLGAGLDAESDTEELNGHRKTML